MTNSRVPYCAQATSIVVKSKTFCEANWLHFLTSYFLVVVVVLLSSTVIHQLATSALLDETRKRENVFCSKIMMHFLAQLAAFSFFLYQDLWTFKNFKTGIKDAKQVMNKNLKHILWYVHTFLWESNYYIPFVELNFQFIISLWIVTFYQTIIAMSVSWPPKH